MVRKIVIVGSTGNLALTRLFPALSAALSKIKEPDLQVVALSTSCRSKEEFVGLLKKHYSEYTESFLNNLEFMETTLGALIKPPEHKSDLSDMNISELGGKNISELGGKYEYMLSEGDAIYLSIPATAYVSVLGEVKRFDQKLRIAFEKPHGTSFESFKQLESHHTMHFIDHYLTKPLTLVLESQLFKSTVLPILQFNLHDIDWIECYFNEYILAEQRVSFDKTGVVMDVMQNHLLQMLVSVLSNLSGDECGKVDLLKKLKLIDGTFVHGQYLGYPEEFGYESQTETAASFMLEFDDMFKVFMCGGKGLNYKKSSIEVVLKSGERIHCVFAATPLKDQSTTQLNSKDERIRTGIYKYTRIDEHDKWVVSESLLSENKLKEMHNKLKVGDDYQYILNNFCSNMPFPSCSYQEIYEAWRIFTPVIEEVKNHPPIFKYSAHSMPEELFLTRNRLRINKFYS